KACSPWLELGLRLLRPQVVLCLGATAAKELLGKEFRLTQQRGEWQSTPELPHVLATIHPAYVLIQPEESIDRLRDSFFGDLRLVAERCRGLGLDAVGAPPP